MNKSLMAESNNLGMNMRNVALCTAVVALLGLASCATVTDYAPTTGVVEVSPNVYEIMDVDYRGIFGSESSLIARNVDQANQFASGRGKVAVPIQARIHRVGVAADFAWFYYKFSLDSPSAAAGKKRFSESMIVRDVRLSKEFYESRNKTDSLAGYDELIKIDDLRKKGIITEAEFEQQKAKILNGR